MLNSLEVLRGATASATDGTVVGTIKNFLFDDQSWDIRHLQVDLNGWLKRQAVVIPVNAAEEPLWNRHAIHILLSKNQVRHSPSADTRKPVSRQQELALARYYGLSPQWSKSGLAPFSAAAGMEFPVSGEDPHLRSAWDIVGYEVWANGRKIGYLDDIIMDDSSWHLGYLDVKTGDWPHNHWLVLPTSWVKSISWAHCRINVDLTHKRF